MTSRDLSISPNIFITRSTSGLGAGTVTSVATDSTLTGGPITVSGTLGINLSNANIRTVLQTITIAGIAVTPTNSLLLQNTTAATLAVPVQISPSIEFKGAMRQSGNSTAHVGTFRMYQVPVSGSSVPGTTAGALQWDSSKDGTYTLNIMNLGRTGILTTAQGFVASGGSINVQVGGITAATSITATDGQVIAGRELFTGTNGGSFGGALYMYGVTSGNFLMKVPSVITNYSMTMPATQGLLGQIQRQISGDGRMEWASQLEDQAGIASIDYNLRIAYDQGGIPVLDFDNLAGTLTFGDIAAVTNGTQLYIQDANKKMVFRVGGSDDATFDGTLKRFTLTDLVSVKSTQYETPTTGSTVTFGDGKEVMTINPAGALLALTIAFPATPADGETRSFNSTQAVTTLTLSGGTFVGGLTSLSLGSFATYVFSSGDSKRHRQA